MRSRWALVPLLLALAALLLASCGGSQPRHPRPTVPRLLRVGLAHRQFEAPLVTDMTTPNAWTQRNALSTTHGGWVGSPTSYSYAWEDCNTQGASCSRVNGATSSTYTLSARDAGDTVRSVVTACNARGCAAASSPPTSTVTRPASSFSPLHVSGSELENQSDQTVELKGVNRAGTEYSCIQNNGFFDGTGSSFTREDAQITHMASWGIDAEMITLNEDCWLGINSSPAAYSNSSSRPPTPGCSATQCPYANAIENIVSTDEAHHIYPVISLFALAPGSHPSTGHIPLADNDHAPLAWEEISDFFKHDPYVIFRLEQEPTLYYSEEAEWQCWAQGDVSYATTSDKAPPTAPSPTGTPRKCNTERFTAYSGIGYDAVGMQSLVNIVRGTGSTNIIMLPGLAYANMWSCAKNESPSICGALDRSTPPVTDPHSPAQLMAEADVYPQGNNCGSPSCYNTVYKPIARTMPFVAGEIGENSANGYYPTTDVDLLMDWIDANGNGYFPYAWDPWANLIVSYARDKAPVSGWGTDYYDHINGITRPAPSQPTGGITFPWSLPSDCVDLSSGSLSPVATSPAVKAGDDLFAVFAGQGYNGPAATVNSVSDNVNGAWTEVASSGSQASRNTDASYSAFELLDSKAAPSGVTLTVNGTLGQSGASGIAFDVRGVASVRASSFQAKLQSASSTYTGPALSSVPSGDVVLGLWGGYSDNETYTAPTRWHTQPDSWVSSGQCAGAAMDWTQPSSTGNVTPTISLAGSSNSQVHYGGALDLQR